MKTVAEAQAGLDNVRKTSMPVQSKRTPRCAAIFWFLLAAAASVATAAPTGGAPLLESLWVWSEFGDRIGTGGMHLLDLDGDGRNEIVATGDAAESYYYDGGRWYEVELEGQLRQSWSSLTYEQGLTLLRIADLGAELQVLAVSHDAIQVHAGSDKRLLRTIPLPTSEVTDVLAADIDGSQGIELVVLDEKSLYVLDFASAVPISTHYGFGGRRLSLGQIDADPARELAIAGNSLGGFVLDGATRSVDWAENSGFGGFVHLIDVDGDGTDEILAGENQGEGLRVLDPDGGQIVWNLESSSVSAVTTGDVDLDGDEEVLFSSNYSYEVLALDEASGEELFAIPTQREVQAIVVGDAVPGGPAEIVWSAGDYDGRFLFVASAADQTILAQSLSSRGSYSGFSVVDADADGNRELVTACVELYDGLSSEGRGLYFDVTTRQLEGATTPVAPSSYDIPAVDSVAAQLDADPATEICFILRDYSNGRLACEDGAKHATEWIVTFPDGAQPHSLRAVQLDLDAELELVVGTSLPAVYAFEGSTGWLKWRTPSLQQYSDFRYLRAADLVDDDAIEVLAAGSVYSSDTIAVFDGETGELVRGPFSSNHASLDVSQVDADAKLDLLVGDEFGQVRQFDLETGQVSPPLVSLSGEVDGIRVVDLTRDGAVDLVAVSEGRLILFDGLGGAPVWTSPYLGESAAHDDRLAVIDLDGDSLAEIAVDTVQGFAIFEAPTIPVFADGFESGDTSAWSSISP